MRLSLVAPDFLPDLDGIDATTWRRAGICGSTTPTTRPAPWRRSRSWNTPPQLARVTTSSWRVDEAYSELWFDDGPPASGLQLGDLTASWCSTRSASGRT
jgi:hypothetical protein